MAIKIVISPTVGFTVKGVINDANGAAQPFDFKLKCKRLAVDQIKEKVSDAGDDTTTTDFLCDVVEGWTGVRGEDDQALEFSKENLRALCQIPHVSRIAYYAYMQQVGAKEKN